MLSLQSMNEMVLEKLKMGLLKQKIAWANFYALQSAKIEPQATVPETITIAGDSDFICEIMYMVIDTEFSAAAATILMDLIDSGSGRKLTREPVDLRTIANPGMFAPASANEGNAHYVTGIPFKYLFRKNSNLQFEFQSTEAAQANDHYVSVTLQGLAVDNWDKIPNDLG